MFGAQEGAVPMHGTVMRYVSFGRGKAPLVILPGLSDGLKTVKGQAVPLAVYFRAFLKDFKVYVFSRKDELEEGCTTRHMAEDLKTALDGLGIEKASILGVSQGGMIAQWFAILYPHRVDKLVLAVSACRATETLRAVLQPWMDWAKRGDYKALMVDTMEKSYSAKRLKTYRLVTPLLVRVGKPKDFGRFLVQAGAALTHDTCDKLTGIACPTLVVGGSSDRVVGVDAAPALAEKIGNSRLVVYEGLGHAAYEEGKGFNRTVKEFLLANS